MEEYQPQVAVSQKHLFNMTVVCGNEIFECSVFDAVLADATRFTRVVYGPLELQVVDVEFWEEIGWVDMYYGEPSPWSALVGPALDYHLNNQQRKN